MPKKELTIQEIVKADCKRYGFDFDQIYTGLHALIQSGGTRVLRHHNTLLVYHIKGEGNADIHLVTADNPYALVSALKQFVVAMKKAGFHTATTSTIDPNMLRMLKVAQVPFTATQEPQSFEGKNAIKYNLTIRI